VPHAGVFHQLFVTIGILLSTVLGMKAIFGNASLWFLLYGLFVVPAGINFGMSSRLYMYTRAAIWSMAFAFTSCAPAQP
jgi:hypothetical protein